MAKVNILVSKKGEQAFQIQLTEEGASPWVVEEINRLLEEGYVLSKGTK